MLRILGNQPRGSMSLCKVYLPQHYTSAVGDRYGVFYDNGGKGILLVTTDDNLASLYLKLMPILPGMSLKCVVASVEGDLIVFESDPVPLRGRKFKRLKWKMVPLMPSQDRKFAWVRAPEVVALGL